MSSTLFTSSLFSELVDSKWYLQTYPDVADAGLSADYHYQKYGQFEGRYPHLLKSVCLEEKLWGGFSKVACEDLSKLMKDVSASLHDRIYSAWVLAKWYASNEEWSAGRFTIELLLCAMRNNKLPAYISSLGVQIIAALILSKLGRTQEAVSLLCSTHTNENIINDLVLTKANLLADAVNSSAQAEEIRLSSLNQIFSKANLAELSKINLTTPLTLSNLAANTVASVVELEKVSIVIPAYNSENHIESALQSLKNQSWQNIEIIVVDDASTDRTRALVEQFMVGDNRVRLISHTQNKGAYAARNTGMHAATGIFLATHDSDDWSHPQKIEILTKALIADSRLIGTMSSWVRIDDGFCFKNINMTARIVHTSVSTLIVKTSILRSLGGWDDVRVAADSEMYERLIHLYGPSCIAEILPGVPLVVAQDLQHSLTNAAATHSNTQFFGVRKTYREIYSVWHSAVKSSGVLPVTKCDGRRSFPAPTAIIDSGMRHNYDIVIFSDFSSSSEYFSALQTIVHQLEKENRAVAIFHWPDYKSLKLQPVADFFIHKALDNRLDILSSADTAICHHLLLFGVSIFSFGLDKLPKIQANSRSVIPDLTIFSKSYNSIFENIAVFDRQIIRNSQLVSSEWYLALYPDIRDVKVNPVEHYIRHGIHEGRSISPFFSESFYNLSYRADSMHLSPAILHYLKFGIKLNFSTIPPRIQGRLSFNRANKTVLLCGHASGIKLFGAERCLLEILDSYYDLGFNMIVTIPEYGNSSYIRDLSEKSFMVIVVPTPLWTQSPQPYAVSTDMYAELIKEFSINAVHVNTVMLREPLIAARQSMIPALVHVHEILDDQDDACVAIKLSADNIYQIVSDFSSHIIANSEYTRRNLLAQQKISIVSNTVNFDRFDIPNIVDATKITVAIISSNLEKKGILEFVELASGLERVCSNVKCLIIGPPTEITSMLQSSNRTIPKNIEFLDYIENPIDAIAMANIIVNMSRCRETFGRTILEGMAARRAVIAYDEGAFPELIDNAVTGFLVPYLDVGAMVAKLHYLCANPAQIAIYGERARDNVLSRFNKTVVTGQLRTSFNLATIS